MGRRKKNAAHYNNNHGWNQGSSNQNWAHQDLGRNHYVLGENLGSETRSLEFKAGPGFIHNGYRENVSKYVCAFANSHENGKLLLGVNDVGEVSGYSVHHQQEDKLRCDTDQAVKDIVPPIFPQDYSVKFVPVHDENNMIIDNLKVIEISVNGARLVNTEDLYSTKKGVFQRRDGGVHEMSAYDIQEWTKQRYKGELEKYKKNEENLQREVQNKQSERRQLDEKLHQKDEELRRREMEIIRLKQQEVENNRLSAENQDLREKLNSLTSEQGNEASNQQLIERLDRIEQQVSQKQQKSKVCAIS